MTDAGAHVTLAVRNVAAGNAVADAIEPKAYSGQSGRLSDGQPSEMLADNVLAFAWIYGDVVHADAERLWETEQHGVKERFRAAAPLVCRLMEMTVATLHVIEWLHHHGLLLMLTSVAFEQEVVVAETRFRQKAEVIPGFGLRGLRTAVATARLAVG